MRVVVVGATGNVGTSVLRSLADEPEVESVLGLARRLPGLRVPKVEWRGVNVGGSDLVECFAGADVVIHLAWQIQPARDPDTVHTANVEGSDRVFRAVAESGVRALVYASSVAAYSPGPKDRRVDESWPTEGVPSSFYSRHKAVVERLLDDFEREQPGVRVVRLRPGLIFKREAASEIRRLFAGALLPSPLLRRELIPLVPAVSGLRFQAVHSHCVGDAFRLAAVGGASGAFNIAAEPVLDADRLAAVLGARPLPLPGGLLRAGAAVSYALRLQPSEPGWLDMALKVPLMDTRRARDELGWEARRSSEEALIELLDGMNRGAGLDTPPLEPAGAGPLRVRELGGQLFPATARWS